MKLQSFARRALVLGIAASALLIFGSAIAFTQDVEAEIVWSAELLTTIEDFGAPESVAIGEHGEAYVSNMTPVMGEDDLPRYWEDDGGGYISILKYNVDQDAFRLKRDFIVDTEDASLNAPKGLSIGGGRLWVNDNARLLSYPLESPGDAPDVYEFEDAQKLNDVVYHEGDVYCSDTGAGVVRVLRKDCTMETLLAPETPNGLTWGGERFYCVTWDGHEMYGLCPVPADEPRYKSFGLEDQFEVLDSIEVLEDGTFLVTDFAGGKICAVSKDRKTVKVLAEMETPADVGLDRDRMLLYVPSVEGDFVNIYQLSHSDD